MRDCGSDRRCSSSKVSEYVYLCHNEEISRTLVLLLCCSRFMRNECLSSRYVYERAMPISRLVGLVGNKSQIPTQRYGRRPFGVGLLVAGYDVRTCFSLSCLFETDAFETGCVLSSRRWALTSTRRVPQPTSSTAKQWRSAHDLKALEPTSKSICWNFLIVG